MSNYRVYYLFDSIFQQWQVHIDNYNGTLVVISCKTELQAIQIRDILMDVIINFIKY